MTKEYPKIILGTDYVFKILIDEDVEVNFENIEAFEKFLENHDPMNIELEEIPDYENRQIIQRDMALRLLSGEFPL